MQYLQVITAATIFILSALASKTVPHELPMPHPGRVESGIHLPIFTKGSLRKRDGQRGAIGLGDFLDLTYNVVVTVGSTTTALILDTGSSDLWVISDACLSNCAASIPLYPQATFQSTGLNAELRYGDSRTGTYALGPIGKDNVGIAGLSLPNQYFAAINDTDTSVLEAGSAGIFGLGFPIISNVWSEVFIDNHTTSNRASKRHHEIVLSNNPVKRISKGVKRVFPHNFNRPAFPSLSRLIPSKHQPRQASDESSMLTTSVLQSYPSTGPFLSRLVASHSLAAPMFTVTLQRDTIEIGGNVGLLSIGELPAGVSNDSLTWVPLRTYTAAQGGLPAPPDAPNEVYPMTWEILIEDVLLDGQKLPRSTLSAPSVSLSALIDTGSSLIRGPLDVIEAINGRLGSRFSCSTPHTLAFQIAGKLFPVDPRDFISPADGSSVSACVTNLAPTDSPVEGDGYLFSWSLGDPFLKSVLSSYYYGNLNYPSRDPPRIGLLSTVPADADDKLRAAVAAASNNGGDFPATLEAPPTGVSTLPTTTGGLPPTRETSGAKGNREDAFRLMVPLINGWFVLLAGMVVGRSLI